MASASPADVRDASGRSVSARPTPPSADAATSWLARPRVACAAAVLAFVVVTGAVAARTARDMVVPGRPELPHYGMRDFRDAVYYPTVAFLDGRDPYRPDAYRAAYPVGSKFPLYVPLTLPLHVPFAVLPFETAAAAHFAVNLGCMLALAALALGASGRGTDASWLFAVAAAIVASRPGHTNLFTGECTAYVVCGALVAILYRCRPRLAAAGLVLAWTKPTFGLPLAALLLARGDRRAVGIGTAIAFAISVAVLVPLVVVEGGPREFLDAMRANYAAGGAEEMYPGASILAIDAGAFVARLLGRMPGGVLDPLDLAASCVVLAGAALAVHRQAIAGRAETPLTAALVCLAVLLGIHHESYDALLLVVPMVALASGAWRPGGEAAPWLRWTLLGLLAIPAVNYVATFRLIETLAIDGTAKLVVTSANGGAGIVAFLACVTLALSRRDGDCRRASAVITSVRDGSRKFSKLQS